MGTKIAAAFALIAAACLPAIPASADERAKEVEDVMREYVRLWNAGDANAIAGRIYKLDNGGGTADSLRSSFASLKAQGYDHSDLHSVKGCLLSANLALAEMRYSRMKTDGSPLAANLATLYKLRRTPEGWRIAELMTMDRSATLTCTSMAGPPPPPPLAPRPGSGAR